MYRFLRNAALVVLICSPVLFASEIPLTADTNNTSYTWDNSSFSGNNPCTLDPIISWKLGNDEFGKALPFVMQGTLPETDPLFTQTITNNTTQTWLDWHVDIRNGTIDKLYDIVVYKKTSAGVQVSPNWDYGRDVYNAGFDDGFGAVYNGSTTAVAPGDKLFVRFRWTAAAEGTPQISQYPTYDGNYIPEPATIIFLMIGLVAFGLKSRKRTN
ncbi:MAG: PEP-CTERM sorting domain-containing protein [Phycisphaerae bacterium]